MGNFFTWGVSQTLGPLAAQRLCRVYDKESMGDHFEKLPCTLRRPAYSISYTQTPVFPTAGNYLSVARTYGLQYTHGLPARRSQTPGTWKTAIGLLMLYVAVSTLGGGGILMLQIYDFYKATRT